jgi:hypothetical protein
MTKEAERPWPFLGSSPFRSVTFASGKGRSLTVDEYIVASSQRNHRDFRAILCRTVVTGQAVELIHNCGLRDEATDRYPLP